MVRKAVKSIIITNSVVVTCNLDGSICYVSGTLAPIVTELASQSDQSHDVRCCDGVSGNTKQLHVAMEHPVPMSVVQTIQVYIY